MKFQDFLIQKQRKIKKHLNIIKDVFQTEHFKIINKLEDADDPYIFIYNPYKNLSFDGVRIYAIADSIAYRVQKESDTHPYGKAYLMPVELWYEEVVTDVNNEEKAASEVAKLIVDEIKEFFKLSHEAEKKIQSKPHSDIRNVAPPGTSVFDQAFDDNA